MERIAVQSSNIKSVGHEGNILEVEFKGGLVYQYTGVPKRVYEELLEAGSLGKYFQRFIRMSYPYRKV